MKINLFDLKRIINEELKRIAEQKDSDCPAPTQDLELNTENRNSAIEAEYIQYGPLNLADTEYWERAAEHCSPRMLECMPGPVSEPLADDEGYLGYCWMHSFKCHSARTCYTWAAGGPITEDEISLEWQDRQAGEDK
jgi:hypothetical protein